MCGRYALGVRMFFVRRRLQEQGMQVDEAPEDDEVRETYNFAPGYYGAVFRADTPDRGYDEPSQDDRGDISEDRDEHEQGGQTVSSHGSDQKGSINYKLQKMRWGLIPFWTKRQPDYGSMMRTINCRDDSLIENKGMWTSMKKKKRCVIVCQGFYEWLKKGPGGKERIPHYIKRKDGDLMYFAGLWDCVQYEESDEKLYTYTIITTDSNPYLKFLHDRMPVILEPGSDQMKKWLDPHQTTWTKELQSILKPYEGELECYPVAKEVGKVGNNSPDFLVPINSKENKNNIANFFANADAKKKKSDAKEEGPSPKERGDADGTQGDTRKTVAAEWTEDNAPKPVPQQKNDKESPIGIKREFSPDSSGTTPSSPSTTNNNKKMKRDDSTAPVEKTGQSISPVKKQDTGERKLWSATKNNSNTSPTKSKNNTKSKHTTSDGSQRITDFFTK